MCKQVNFEEGSTCPIRICLTAVQKDTVFCWFYLIDQRIANQIYFLICKPPITEIKPATTKKTVFANQIYFLMLSHCRLILELRVELVFAS